MEILKDWVSDICVTILFMTAIELVLPENSIKRYAKFVLGLIFIVVVINPIINFVNQDNNLYKDIAVNENYIDKFDDYLKNNFEEYSERARKTTLESFEENISRNCKIILENKFKKNKFDVEAFCVYQDGDFKILEVIVRVEEHGVKKIETIEEVIIDDKQDNKFISKEGAKAKEIRKFLSNELNISENIIKVYLN